MNLTFHSAIEETKTIKTYFFKSDLALEYTAGQFIELTIPHDKPDNRGPKRWFTLSSAPTQELLSITTRLTADDGSTFKKKLDQLKAGDQVLASAAMGDFVLPKLLQTELVFVALGIGVTPFLSMLQWLTDTKEKRPIRLIHAVKTEDDIIFQDIFEASAVHATIVVAKPSPAWGGERGHVAAEMILGLEKPSDDTLIYLSGPEQVVESLTKELVTAGLRKDQIVGDYFPGYPDQT